MSVLCHVFNPIDALQYNQREGISHDNIRKYAKDYIEQSTRKYISYSVVRSVSAYDNRKNLLDEACEIAKEIAGLEWEE